MEKSVYLLYEGEWLSKDSLVLMGIFTTERKLFDAARELIAERGSIHLDFAKEVIDSDYESVDDVIEDILRELRSRGATSEWDTNYCYVKVELDELGNPLRLL